MTSRMKAALLVLSTGAVAFGSGACFFRWLGDAVGDAIFYGALG